MTLTPPGWYPDPERPGTPRWWDGQSWAAQTAGPAVAPVTQVALVAPGGAPFPLAGQTGFPVQHPRRVAPRRRSGWIIAVAGLAVVLVVAAVGAGLSLNKVKTPFAGQTPAQVTKTVYAKAMATGSFSYSTAGVSTINGQVERSTFWGTANRNSGIQYSAGAFGKATISVIGAKTYLKGDAVALATTLGWSDVEAKQYANQWIALVAADSPYAAVTFAVTTQDYWGDPTYPPAEPFPQVPQAVSGEQTVGGRSVQTITSTYGNSSARTTYAGTFKLNFAAGGGGLPTGSVDHQSSHYTQNSLTFNENDIFTGSYSGWGTAAAVSAPSNPLVYATLPASSPTPNSPLTPWTAGAAAGPPTTTLN